MVVFQDLPNSLLRLDPEHLYKAVCKKLMGMLVSEGCKFLQICRCLNGFGASSYLFEGAIGSIGLTAFAKRECTIFDS